MTLTRRSGLRLPDARPAAAPIGEVQALLDDLAPACQITSARGRQCEVPAEWLAHFTCDCGRIGNHAITLCPSHLHFALMTGLDSSLSREHVGHRSWPRSTERIRSKPTK